MKIIISPAKKMNVNNDDIYHETNGVFIKKTEEIVKKLKELTYENLKNILQCNDQIATLNFDRYRWIDLNRNLTPAILAYEGIQYKYMAPNSFSKDEYDYIQKNLIILSGLYGALKPFDGVVPYRLEMQAKLIVGKNKNLYEYWDDTLYKEVTKDDKIILNLASKEYSKVIEKYISKEVRMITCVFGTLVDEKIKVKATEAKMARGLMVRYLATNNIEDLEEIKNFSDLGFNYDESRSSVNEFVFIK